MYQEGGANFKALEAGILMAHSEFRYPLVGFKLISDKVLGTDLTVGARQGCENKGGERVFFPFARPHSLWLLTKKHLHK